MSTRLSFISITVTTFFCLRPHEREYSLSHDYVNSNILYIWSRNSLQHVLADHKWQLLCLTKNMQYIPCSFPWQFSSYLHASAVSLAVGVLRDSGTCWSQCRVYCLLSAGDTSLLMTIHRHNSQWQSTHVSHQHHFFFSARGAHPLSLGVDCI